MLLPPDIRTVFVSGLHTSLKSKAPFPDVNSIRGPDISANVLCSDFSSGDVADLSQGARQASAGPA